MRQLRALLAASFLICCLLTTIANAQDQALQLGTPIERELGPGQTQMFTITLEENQFVQLVVEQRGIDVVVRVSSPAGKSLGDFDSPNGDNGPENVSFVATEQGAYRIAVAPLNQEGAIPTGKFEIKLIELRQATEQEIKTNKNLEIVKAKGLALLGDVDGLIPEIHSPQTRIRAQLQAAQLLWDTDEKRASKYLSDAAAAVKELLASIDPTTQEYQRNYSVITQLRFEIIRVLADRDPDAALNFLYSSKVPPNPYGNQREQVDQERSVELSIANQVLAKDPKKALDLARQSLKRGYSSSLINTISMLRQKNSELASQLATDVANKLLGEKLLKNNEAASLAINLLGACNSTQRRIQRPGYVALLPEPLLPEATCHDLLQKTIQEALSFTPPGRNIYTSERDAAWGMLNGLKSLGLDLDANAEGGAAAVEKKLNEMNDAANPYQATVQRLQGKMQEAATDGALESIQKAPEEIREQLYIDLANTLAAKGEGARARQIINDNITNPYQRRQVLSNIEQQELYQAMSRGKVDEALRAIANMRTPRERANMLMQIIRQIGPGQKRASALNFLEQARSLLAPGVQAQDQEQMNALLELARAFSRYDSKRGFEILDPLVEQLNELCAAARTLEGFGMEYYQDDELDLQNGNVIANLAQQISGALGTLAITNFERAKLTSDKLQLPEVRLRAYLEIAQQTIQGSK
jgi:hypothetical protein